MREAQCLGGLRRSHRTEYASHMAKLDLLRIDSFCSAITVQMSVKLKTKCKLTTAVSEFHFIQG